MDERTPATRVCAPALGASPGKMRTASRSRTPLSPTLDTVPGEQPCSVRTSTCA